MQTITEKITQHKKSSDIRIKLKRDQCKKYTYASSQENKLTTDKNSAVVQLTTWPVGSYISLIALGEKV